jgi:hypothetical protein
MGLDQQLVEFRPHSSAPRGPVGWRSTGPRLTRFETASPPGPPRTAPSALVFVSRSRTRRLVSRFQIAGQAENGS